jgi:tetratricopeptide (TPR) repeat protein
MEKITEYLIRPAVTEKGTVKAWEEDILLPTYAIGQEEKNPIFLEKRVYQGSSGAVYPYPVVEKICDEKQDKPYRALFLENEYLKIMILPELGGRVQMAYDKIKQRHFVYYNQVVKPALVGLTGPWISGGIEFNWPQHHRPSTFLPTDYLIEENSDGSKTVWCNEVERMFRTKGMQGFTLYPGKAYLEIKVKVYNRTPFPQTFLWWANPAVVVHGAYNSVFPPDVHAVFDHGKRDVSNFPIATGVYYKQDYSAGVDISKYKNIPVPTSYMAIRSKYDFVGGYETDTQAGLLHVADHHVSPGKKQWTWGNGDFGCAWDRNLTDEDGPYIELMTGVYTDNQPDFSWLQPYEEKSWTQYFMPYSEAGYVKNATKEAIVNVEVKNGEATIIVYTTGIYKNIKIGLVAGPAKSGAMPGCCHVLLDAVTDISPGQPYREAVKSGDWLPEDLLLEVKDADGRLLVSYRADRPAVKPIPEPARAARNPKDIASVEQLFLTGLHLEQYRHATYNPFDYYMEALNREPGDVRCNNAAGLLWMRRAQFAKAEPYFRKAIETLTERNPNPYDGEPFYNLGWCLKMQNRLSEAYDAFFKSAWNAAWQDAAYLALAQIETAGCSGGTCAGGEKFTWTSALDKVERSLTRNWHNHKSRQLKASVLRRQGRKEEARKWIEDSLHIDGFNMGCRFELYLLTGDHSILAEIKTLMGGRVHACLEYALDFAAAGLYEEAAVFLTATVAGNVENAKTTYPMVYYALGYFYSMSGNPGKAKEYDAEAARMPSDYCFPNRIEEVNILQDAMRVNPADAKAPYYLGNFWYAARQYSEAVACWEKSAATDNTFPTVLRNLSLAYYNKTDNKTGARQMLEKAFDLDPADARILMELDQLYKKLGLPHAERLAFLEKYLPLVEQRDDLCIERITLLNSLGQYEKARRLIASHKFHPWEGGEGKVTGQYVLCRVALAKQAIAEKRPADALALLKETEIYPHNLGEGKLPTAEENDIDYYKGVAYRGMGDEENARRCFEKAAQGSSEPAQAFFYNDQQPDKIFYQGLAWRALGNEDKANSRFYKLIAHGEKHLFDNCRIDYFAVSLPDLAIWDDDLNRRNVIHCNYVMGLGCLGLRNRAKAREFLEKVIKMDVNHQGGQIHFDLIDTIM